ncbi:MAG: hypothetical protein HYZ53_06585 [Planctomycetes bacterium]|nr:hypothetical protein [Planctomycetota bacterium]
MRVLTYVLWAILFHALMLLVSSGVRFGHRACELGGMSGSALVLGLGVLLERDRAPTAQLRRSLALLPVLGFCLGLYEAAWSIESRAAFERNGVHWEAVLTMFVALPLWTLALGLGGGSVSVAFWSAATHGWAFAIGTVVLFPITFGWFFDDLSASMLVASALGLAGAVAVARWLGPRRLEPRRGWWLPWAYAVASLVGLPAVRWAAGAVSRLGG